jgi:ubiquinol-cytochrome c reductase cytochrome c subunit
MRRALLFACAVALVAVPAAFADPPQSGVTHVHRAPGTSLVDWGEQLFGANCVTCHGPNGRGITSPVHGAGDEEGIGPSLHGVGARAADFYLRTGYMPLDDARKQPHRSHVLFSQGELAALVAYVASLGGGPVIPKPHPQRGNLAEGQELFTEHCAGCHQIAAEGGYLTGGVAPPLLDATQRQVAEAIRIGPYLMPRFTTRDLTPHQVDSIVRYVEYAKHPDDPGGWAIGRLGPVPEGMVTWFLAAAALVAVCIVIGKRLRSE